MKLREEERNVKTSVSEKRRFKIAENAKAFKALIDGLYSKKAESITREIWSNAYDAHTEAGNTDRPFKVTFPSLFNNEFRVRDYGVGLSHEGVMGLYTTMFKSTKENTNSQTGKWGLGSKSPFAYTDTYGVTSWHGGKKRVYAAVIGADGVPTINLMHEEDSSEETGLEVTFPVDARDVDSFREAAEWVSLAYDVKPEGFKPKKSIEYKIERPGIYSIGHFVDQSGHEVRRIYGDSRVYARMGTALYPIVANDYVSSSDIDYLTRIGCPDDIFILPFEIGEIEVTLSRESLSFGKDEPTGPAITKRLKEVRDLILEDLKDAIDSCDSLEEASKLFRSSTNYETQSAFTHVNSNWANSTQLKLEEYVQNQSQKLTWKRGRFTTKWGRFLNCPLLMELDQFRFCWYDSQATANAKTGDSYTGWSRENLGTRVYVLDKRTGAPETKHNLRRIRQDLVANNINCSPYLEIRDDNEKEALAQLEILKKRRKKGNVEVVYTHLITYTHPKKGRSKVKLRSLSEIGHYRQRITELTPEEFDEGGYFLKMCRNDLEAPVFQRSFQGRGWRSILGLDDDDKVVVVPKTYWSRFEKDPDWINLEDTAVDFERSGEFQRLTNLGACMDLLGNIDDVLYANTWSAVSWPQRHKAAIMPIKLRIEKILASITDDEKKKIRLVRGSNKTSIASFSRIESAIRKERKNLFPLLDKLSGWNDSDVKQYEYLVMNQKGS